MADAGRPIDTLAVSLAWLRDQKALPLGLREALLDHSNAGRAIRQRVDASRGVVVYEVYEAAGYELGTSEMEVVLETSLLLSRVEEFEKVALDPDAVMSAVQLRMVVEALERSK